METSSNEIGGVSMSVSSSSSWIITPTPLLRVALAVQACNRAVWQRFSATTSTTVTSFRASTKKSLRFRQGQLWFSELELWPFQPQFSAPLFSSSPNQRRTWWYVRNACCLTAPSVGGRVERLCFMSQLQKSLRDFVVLELLTMREYSWFPLSQWSRGKNNYWQISQQLVVWFWTSGTFWQTPLHSCDTLWMLCHSL